MAKKFLTNIYLAGNELQNARTHNLAAAPSTPGLGQRYYNTVTNIEYYWNGSAWIPTDAAAHTGIPLSALAVDPLARANHTGTQLASTISNFDTQVRASRLDQMAAPTAGVSMNSQVVSNVATPVAGTDAANKNYVDNAVQSASAGIDSKASCRLVSTTNIAALSGLTAIDGVTPIAGDRLLLVGQTTPAQNGVYVAAAGAWSRATDSDAIGEITPGAFWFVEEGTTYGKSQWRCSNTGTITLGTTGVTITQFGATSDVVAGNGVSLTGNTLNVGAGTGISVGADTVGIDTAVVVRKFAKTFGDGAANSYTITHNLATQDVTVSVRQVSDNVFVECDVQSNEVNTVVLSFAAAVALNSLRVTVHG